MTASAYIAAKQHLAELAANGVPVRDRPSALHHGLITQLVHEIEQLRAQLPTASPALERKWDALFPAAVSVTAAYETYSNPDRARPTRGIFQALDRLADRCAELKVAVDTIAPDSKEVR